MRILLDTHIVLWCLEDSPKLSKIARAHLDQAVEIYVSSASIWEMAIKIRIGKLKGEISHIITAILSSGFKELPISFAHTDTVSQLPNLHKDPFDRILVAQSICEPLRLLTADTLLKPYSDLIEVV